MKRVLLIFETARIDTYQFLSKDEKTEYVILWHELPPNNNISLPKFIKKEYFWSNYHTPARLLEDIKPDVIVFVEILDLKQIALNISARSKGIKTIFLDHGAAGDLEHIKELVSSRRKYVLLDKIKKILLNFNL